MKLTDTNRLDFLEKWETSSHHDSWFTLLTGNVKKLDRPTLRDFCDYSIGFEKMIDLNGLDVLAWNFLPLHLQEIVVTVWEKESRVLTEDEKSSLQEESTRYWEELHKTEIENLDK